MSATNDDGIKRMDRRTVLKWVGAAVVAFPMLEWRGFGQDTNMAWWKPTLTDPDLLNPGKMWGRTLTKEELRTAAALCDVIIPADEKSPSASQVGLPDFIDEWVSAPYPAQQADSKTVRAGLAWLNGESKKRFEHDFADLDDGQKTKICDDICYAAKAAPEFRQGAHFFAKMRDLTSSGFYTTPEGMKDLDYRGNVALTKFDGPPPEVLKHLGLA
jgi:hypothetical protein